jgi:CRISPR/Cas system-associated exonuclease Cas4 (RecB family)
MKNINISCIRAVVLGAMLAAAGITSGFAQSTTTQSTTTTTSSAGTISDFSPDAMTVRTETSSTPVNYTFSKTTTYVDENGNPVSVDVVKSGVPVTVYYTQDGDHMLASKVVVRKVVTTDPATTVIEQKKTTTTTTSTSGQ